MVYMHSRQYMKSRQDGTVRKAETGRYYLEDGREVIVNDGCPQEGIHEQKPEQKPMHTYHDPAFVGGDGT